MKNSKCNKCGEIVMPWWTYCPSCGELIPEDDPPKVMIKCPHCDGTGKIEIKSLFDIKTTQK